MVRSDTCIRKGKVGEELDKQKDETTSLPSYKEKKHLKINSKTMDDVDNKKQSQNEYPMDFVEEDKKGHLYQNK